MLTGPQLADRMVKGHTSHRLTQEVTELYRLFDDGGAFFTSKEVEAMRYAIGRIRLAVAAGVTKAETLNEIDILNQALFHNYTETKGK